MRVKLIELAIIPRTRRRGFGRARIGPVPSGLPNELIATRIRAQPRKHAWTSPVVTRTDS